MPVGLLATMVPVLACLLLATVVAEVTGTSDNPVSISRRLEFNAEGKFKIVQFTDLHYGNDERDNIRTAAVQDAVLSAENPDLVIVTGDLISGYEWDRIKRPHGWFENLWEKFIAPMVRHNTRWAITLGNHDVEANLNAERIVDLEKTQELSLTQHGPSSIAGVTNYFLPIYSHNTTDDDIGQIIWVFDSGSNRCVNVSGYGCVEHEQVAWYKSESSALASSTGVPIPAIAFVHIPLYEHLDMWNVQGVYGDLADGDGVCCSALNTGLFAAMKQVGDIAGVFSGHDHSNDYVGDYHGISLGYGRKTGYGSYGPPLGWQKGARVFELSEHQFGFNTWLRLEDGTKEIQKFNSVSMRKFLGCCNMPGHGRAWAGWYALLITGFINLLVLSAIVVAVVACVRVYNRRRRRQYIYYGGDDDDVFVEEENLPIGKRLVRRLASPVPRQRRSGAVDVDMP